MPLRFFKTFKLDDIEKRPLVVMIAILIGSNIYFISRSDDEAVEAKKETKEWQDKAWNLTMGLLISNQIIKEQEKEVDSLKSVTSDSTVRKEVEKPLNNILP